MNLTPKDLFGPTYSIENGFIKIPLDNFPEIEKDSIGISGNASEVIRHILERFFQEIQNHTPDSRPKLSGIEKSFPQLASQSLNPVIRQQYICWFNLRPSALKIVGEE